jgi:hypothetical protein
VRLARLTRNLREDLRDEWEARNRVRADAGLDPLPLPDFLLDPSRTGSGADSDGRAIATLAVVAAFALILALLIASGSGDRADKQKADTLPSAGRVLQRS